MHKLSNNLKYKQLIDTIGSTFQLAKSTIVGVVNVEMLNAYWEIGRHLVEFEQKGNIKAKYGKQLLSNLSKDLKSSYGRGFSRSNLNYMRLFYIKYPICETVSHKLTF